MQHGNKDALRLRYATYGTDALTISELGDIGKLAEYLEQHDVLTLEKVCELWGDPCRSIHLSPTGSLLLNAIKAGQLDSLDDPNWKVFRDDTGKEIRRVERSHHTDIRITRGALREWLTLLGLELPSAVSLWIGAKEDSGYNQADNEQLKVHDQASADFEPSVKRSDEWRDILISAIRKYKEEHKVRPTKWSQLWSFILANPPREYGVTIELGMRGRPQVLRIKNGPSLSKNAFKKRFDRLPNLSVNADSGH